MRLARRAADRERVRLTQTRLTRKAHERKLAGPLPDMGAIRLERDFDRRGIQPAHRCDNIAGALGQQRGEELLVDIRRGRRIHAHPPVAGGRLGGIEQGRGVEGVNHAEDEEGADQPMGVFPLVIGELDIAVDDRHARCQGQRNQDQESCQRDPAQVAGQRALAGDGDQHEMEDDERKTRQSRRLVALVHSVEAAEERLEHGEAQRQHDRATHQDHSGRGQHLGDDLAQIVRPAIVRGEADQPQNDIEARKRDDAVVAEAGHEG